MGNDIAMNSEADLPAVDPASAGSPSWGWSVAALLLALTGAAIAAVLVREHLEVTEGGLAKGLFCGGAGTFDCGQVAAHESSWLLGLPVALWGLGYYLVAIGLALAALVLRPQERAAAASLGALLALTALVFDAYLGWVMVTQIGAICLNCVATYGINLLLALAFWRSERVQGVAADPRALALSWRGQFGKIAIALLVAVGLVAAGVLTWNPLHDLETFAREETLEFLAKTHQPPEIDMTRFAGLASRGPADAPLTIVVAGDFQCHFCRALSSHVERLRLESPRRVRVVYLNSPVSSVCNPAIKENSHEDACWLAEVGECAALQGKFWQYHDYLYHHLAQPQVTRANVESRLAAIGLDPARVRACLVDGTARTALAREIALANQLQLVEVPSIVINGHARRAGVYPAMLRTVVHVMLGSL
jgi:uncharacterized membrane protein/predicted DsbA family dithiol-disulfide isomerase